MSDSGPASPPRPEEDGLQLTNNMPAFMQIMEDVFLAQHRWLLRNTGKAVRMGITHVIAPTQLLTQAIRD
jgi:hypothetical protein